MSAGPRAGRTRARAVEAKTCCHRAQRRGEVGGRGDSPEARCPDYLLYILDAAIGQGDASHPHGTPVSIGALPVELGPSRLIDVTALGAQELLEDGDYSSSVTPVRVFFVLLSKSRNGRDTG